MGYVGFLAGPPVIAGMAEWVTLRGGMGLVAVPSLLIMPLAGAAARRSVAPP